MDKVKATKNVVNFAVGVGVGKIVADVVKRNVHPTTKYQKIVVAFGQLGIAMMISELSTSNLNHKIDNAIKNFREAANS